MEFHHRHADSILGGVGGIEQVKKAICCAPLRRIRVDNPRKEVGGLQGNGDCSFGEPSNVEIGADSGSNEYLRGANLLQGGHDRDFEVHDGLETRMEKFQGTTEEDGMEYGGISHNESESG